MRKKHYILIALLIIASILTLILVRGENAPGPYSAWFWSSVTELSETEKKEYIKKAVAHNIDTLYVRVDEYIDIVEGTRDVSLEDFVSSIRSFIEMANESGIRVEALSGAPEWAREDYRYIPHSLLDFIFEYNRENPDASFSGVHFDIEPYGAEEFEEEGDEMMSEYIFLVEELVERVTNEGGGELTLGFAVPYWYIGEREDFPTVRFDGEEKEVGEALIEILDSYEHSYIAIMAYRVEAGGSNGTIEISKPLLRDASEGSRNVSVYIGQETAETEEESISFFGSTKESFKSEARQIDDALQAFGAYEGIVIHHLESFLELN